MNGQHRPPSAPADDHLTRPALVNPHTQTPEGQLAWEATETAPTEYYVPANATKTLELLRHHGIMMKQTTTPVSGLQQFTIAIIDVLGDHCPVQVQINGVQAAASPHAFHNQ